MKSSEEEWLEEMLSYSSNMLSQISDLTKSDLAENNMGFIDYPVTSGPVSDPDRYDIDGLLKEIRSRRPNY